LGKLIQIHLKSTLLICRGLNRNSRRGDFVIERDCFRINLGFVIISVFYTSKHLLAFQNQRFCCAVHYRKNIFFCMAN
jgi:hypothetical protein